jgi:ABC-2 type transport system ATP-binding protein
MLAMTTLVEAVGLTRMFDARVAVDDLSMRVAAGEIVSLLGPNGAGKTTTFRMLAALILPTRGHVAVGGVALTPATSDALRGRVGLLTEAPGLWERLTVRWNLRTHALLQGVTDVERRVAAIMDRVGIADRADERAGALSKGLKQRVALARALLHDPPVVLLDEPTSGLDPESARHVRDLILGFRQDGRAVLVSTHNLAEAEALSDRIAVLNTRLLAFDTPDRLRHQRSGSQVEIEVEGPADRYPDIVQRCGASVTVQGPSTITLVAPAADRIPDIVSALVEAGARIRRVEPRSRSLEDAYLALVRQDD